MSRYIPHTGNLHNIRRAFYFIYGHSIYESVVTPARVFAARCVC